MSKDREFDNILDECLEKMLRGRSIEQCLADYPDYAAALEPMLRTAARAKMTTNIRPRPEFRDRARHQFQAAIREMAPAPARTRGFFPSLRPAWMALTVLVAVIIAGGGTVYAAGNALPDSPLYPVKMATEQVRLFLTPSDIGKAELYAEFADERVEEIIRMADKGSAELVQETTDRLNTQLVAMASLTIGDKGTSTGGDTFALEAEDTSRNGEAVLTVPQTTTVTATAAPTMATPAPEPVTDEPPATEKTTRPEAVAIAPPVSTDAALSDSADRQSTTVVSEEDGDLDRIESLKELLLRRAIENPDALKEALETAPESLRDILLWAIEVADSGYDEAIRNLE